MGTTMIWCLGVILSLFVGPSHGFVIDDKAKTYLDLIVLHNNDMHARFEQTKADSSRCTAEDAKLNKCYGGFARVAHVVREYRLADKENKGPKVLYLNAGDTYTGTPWFTLFKDNITAAFLNILKPDAISLGNHEFDEGVEGLTPFLKEVTFPVLACNLDLSKVPDLRNSPALQPFITLNVSGVKVGVVGYLTPDTAATTKKTDVAFLPEIDAINAATKVLTKDGVNIIIALGHSGYEMDKMIAEKCPDVDIVIGGHTNTFLYNGTQPDAERIDGPYPTMIRQSEKKMVPVVQAYAYTKYLGKLHMKFDKDGNLIEYDGSPILLHNNVSRDPDVLALLDLYRPNITALEKTALGYSQVDLDGSKENCRLFECNLGNLLTDAMVYARAIENQGGDYWTDAAIAFIQGGGIRSSITGRKLITEYDAGLVLPFGNDVYIVEITGATIRAALEHSAAVHKTDFNGGFLQMSGIHVTYDFSRNKGQRVVSVRARCARCRIPSYDPLVDTANYKVLLQDFLMTGGDNHTFPLANASLKPERLQKNDMEIFTLYLADHKEIFSEVEGRITVVESKPVPGGNKGSAAQLAGIGLVLECFRILTVYYLR